MRANPGDIFATPERRQIRLHKKIAEGAEGSVFDVVGEPNLVAKKYHHTEDAKIAEKLKAMTRSSQTDTELFNFSAWPKELLLDRSHNGVIGFLMPKMVGYRNIHQLYGPKDRQTYFPDANWGFLVHAALNCSVAFAGVHARGHVIGDVNHSNVLVNNNAMVSLIDCDSMGIRDATTWFPCSEVGVVEFTAPELQGLSLAGLDRTQNHDLFGLAVIIFHLLLLRHPFMGALRVPSSGDSPEIGISIANSAFAYSRNRQTPLVPVQNWPLLDCVSPEISAMFEQAFESPALGTPPQRPFAKAWVKGLRSFEKSLKTCPRNSGHRYYPRNKDCPWCSIISSRGYDFFVTADATLSAWSPSKAEIPALLKGLAAAIEISDDLKASGSSFCPRLPAPLPFRQLQCPIHPGTPPDEYTRPPGISEKPSLPMVQLTPPELVPFPQEPMLRDLPAPRMPRRRTVESPWRYVFKRRVSYTYYFLVLIGLPSLLTLLQISFLAICILLTLIVPIGVFILLRMIRRLNAEERAVYFTWLEESRNIWEAHAKLVEIHIARHEADKLLWRKKCDEIFKGNQARREVYDLQRKTLEEERKKKQAELESVWEANNRLELEKWRRQLQVEKINWISKKTEYDRLHTEYVTSQKLFENERDARRLLVESLTQEVESLEASLKSQELLEMARLKKSLSTTIDAFGQKWTSLQHQFAEEVKACENITQQLEDFLRVQPLPRDLSGVGPVLYNSLIAAGITSAADCNITDLLNVHGIGEKKANAIMNWMSIIKMRFTPTKDFASSPKRLRINAKYGALAARLKGELDSLSRAQVNSLNRTRQGVSQKQQAISALRKQLIQAKIDYSPFISESRAGTLHSS